MIDFQATNPVTFPGRNIATMSCWNCYTKNGVLKGVLSEGSSESRVCHGPCSTTSQFAVVMRDIIC